MKLKKVILILAIILVILGMIALIFPKQGVDIGSLHLSFPSLEDIFSPKQIKYANIDNIVASSDTISSNDNHKVTIDKKNIIEFEYPNNNQTLLYSFFESMDKARSNDKQVRIIHYGDSQIEGDRITSYIRLRLQEQFSGVGQGQMPLHSLSSIRNVTFSYSSNWSFFSILNQKSKGFNRFGLMMSCVRPFVKMKVDTITHDTTYLKSAYIELKFSKRLTHNLHLFYSNPVKESSIKVYSNSGLIAEQTIGVDNSLMEMNIPISSPTSYIKIATTGMPELYSIDESSNSGVMVDNVSLRGSSAIGMSRNDKDFFSIMAQRLNVNLIIMQFGVNAIPQDDSKIIPSYAFFEKQFSQQLAYLKKAVPNCQIIVIGISDRSRKVGDKYETNPNVEKVLAAQKQAAMENGCIFWNLFKAMGGKNSMPSWVLRDRPLANPDFTHFNNVGAKYVAEMFYQALNLEYQKYKQSKSK